jgi:hypothetical protein
LSESEVGVAAESVMGREGKEEREEGASKGDEGERERERGWSRGGGRKIQKKGSVCWQLYIRS